jgi:hypothetical protein
LGGGNRVGVVHANWTTGAQEHVGPVFKLYQILFHNYTVLQVSRLCVADLSVDSLVYNGMTTACDSLWANVPLVSTPGHTMCVVRSSINSIDA